MKKALQIFTVIILLSIVSIPIYSIFKITIPKWWDYKTFIELGYTHLAKAMGFADTFIIVPIQSLLVIVFCTIGIAYFLKKILTKKTKSDE